MNDSSCIFCKISSREIPSEKIYESENFFVFLDIRPRAPGHALIVPKEHHRWVWDVPQTNEYFEITKKIALAQRKAYGTESVWLVVQGDEVPHAHISVFPNPHETQGDKMDLKGNAEKIRKFI